MYRLLHIADLHLDRAFSSMGCRGELARLRRRGLRDALRRAGEAALERGCDAVTIGGDLYEHERAGVDTARFLAETFAAWRPMKVFVAPGNHDPLVPGSIYRRSEWPENVTIFGDPTLVPVHLDDGLTLWGLAHREPEWRGNPLTAGPAGKDGVHLALFHGAELGSLPEGKSVHGPFVAGDVRARGFAAALCGHYHRRRLDPGSGLLYPGSPEPLSFNESCDRGPVLVEVTPSGGVSFEPLALNRWWAMSIECDVASCATQDAVIAAIVESCEPCLSEVSPERALVRADLVGATRCSLSLDASSLEAAAQESLGCALLKVRDLTNAEPDVTSALRQRSTRGAFARLATRALEDAQDDESAALLRDALRYGLSALAGCEVALR